MACTTWLSRLMTQGRAFHLCGTHIQSNYMIECLDHVRCLGTSFKNINNLEKVHTIITSNQHFQNIKSLPLRHCCPFGMVIGDFPSIRNAKLWYFVVIQNKLLKGQSSCRWFEAPGSSCYITVMHTNASFESFRSFSDGHLTHWP